MIIQINELIFIKTKENEKQNYLTCIENAVLYKSKKEFIKNNRFLYNISVKNGWIYDFYWFESQKEQYFEYITENTFSQERLWFNVIFYETIENLKECNVVIYNYISENICYYYDKSGHYKYTNDNSLYANIVEKIKTYLFEKEIQYINRDNNSFIKCVLSSIDCTSRKKI